MVEYEGFEIIQLKPHAGDYNYPRHTKDRIEQVVEYNVLNGFTGHATYVLDNTRFKMFSTDIVSDSLERIIDVGWVPFDVEAIVQHD